MTPHRPSDATGTVVVFLPGLGAVSTTFVAGVMLCRRGVGRPIGSLTEMGRIRLGKRTEGRVPTIRELIPLATLDDLCFETWDIFEDDAYEAARHAAVLSDEHLATVKDELERIRPMPAVFSPQHVRRLHGRHVKNAATKMDAARALEDDIRRCMRDRGATRGVMIWCGSTEVLVKSDEVHATLKRFEEGLAKNDPGIAPTMIYAYAALRAGIPFANASPNLAVDAPALQELARERGIPIAGKDLKTGQTLMKTIIAPGLKARMLGLRGWFSTNILGNRDGEVLDDPESFKAKEVSKLGVIDAILQPHLYPELYEDVFHKVRIEYYPPRGDQKEGWDNLDLVGWLGYPMQLKINFLCRDSVLAAPLVLDLVLFLDLAARARMTGIQEWLSFYFKSPMAAPSLYPEHDLFIQAMKLKNTLRRIAGEELITHLGLDYYE